MTTTYIIDKIRQIAIWACGSWSNIMASPTYIFTEVDRIQKCRRDVALGGFRYPVAIIGNEYSPIIPGEYIESDWVHEVSIPDCVKRIGNYAFSDNIFAHAKMVLPESLLEIGCEAFWNSNMKKIVIPQNVIFVGNNAFPPEMEVECLSPHLIRGENNSFITKRYIPEGSLLECRISDPIKKEASACRFVGKDGENFVFPDSVNIEGEDYLITGIDCDFSDEIYGEINLPTHLRKIGHGFNPNWGSFKLPDTVKYIGENSILKGIEFHLPEGLRFIGKGNTLPQAVNHSLYIDIERHLVTDVDGTPLYYFGEDKTKEIEDFICEFRQKQIKVEDQELDYDIEELDYKCYDYLYHLDSSTF